MDIGDVEAKRARQLASALGAAFLQPLLTFSDGADVTDLVVALRTLEYILWHGYSFGQWTVNEGRPGGEVTHRSGCSSVMLRPFSLMP